MTGSSTARSSRPSPCRTCAGSRSSRSRTSSPNAASSTRADVPPEDLPDLWRLRSLIDAGVSVAAGSDAPFGSEDLWHVMRAAVRRPPLFRPDEAVSPARALALFLGEPAAPGTQRLVAPGQPADLVLLRAGPHGSAGLARVRPGGGDVRRGRGDLRARRGNRLAFRRPEHRDEVADTQRGVSVQDLAGGGTREHSSRRPAPATPRGRSPAGPGPGRVPGTPAPPCHRRAARIPRMRRTGRPVGRDGRARRYCAGRCRPPSPASRPAGRDPAATRRAAGIPAARRPLPHCLQHSRPCVASRVEQHRAEPERERQPGLAGRAQRWRVGGRVQPIVGVPGRGRRPGPGDHDHVRLRSQQRRHRRGARGPQLRKHVRLPGQLPRQ